MVMVMDVRCWRQAADQVAGCAPDGAGSWRPGGPHCVPACMAAVTGRVLQAMAICDQFLLVDCFGLSGLELSPRRTLGGEAFFALHFFCWLECRM